MRCLARIAAAVALLVLVSIACVALYLEFLFDANRYKPRLVAAVRDTTGREMEIDGDLSVGLFPSPYASVGAARLLNRSDFNTATLAEIAAARVSFELLPLLRRQVQIEEIRIDGLRVALHRKAKGQDNWSDLMGARSQESEAENHNGELSVESLRIDDAQLSLKDEARGRDMSLSELTLRAGGWGHSAAAPMNLVAKLASQTPKLQGNLSLDGETQLDLPKGQYAARKLVLKFEGSGPAGPIVAELSGDAALDRPAETLNATLIGKLLGLDVEAQFAAQGISSKPSFEGQLAVAEFDPRKLMSQLGRAVPDTRDASTFTRASFKTQVKGDGSGLKVGPIDARLDTSKIGGRITVADYAAPRIDFRLAVDQIDLDRYRPPEPQPPSLEDNAISRLSKDSLRESGYTVTGEVNIGVLILARDRTENYRAIIEAGP